MRIRARGRQMRIRRVGLARVSSRGAFRAVAVALVVVAAGVTAGSAPAATEQAVSLTLRYACGFPSGSQPVSAQVTATFPAIVTAGKPFEPTGARITVSLSRAAVADLSRLHKAHLSRLHAARLSRLHAARVSMTAGLATEVMEGTRSATATWRDFRAPAKAVPASGPLPLTASGSAPPVTAAAGGEVTVTAGGLSLVFTVRTASSRLASPSSARVACAPRPGQDTTLARTTVTPAASSPGQSHRRSTQAAASQYCPHFPKGLKLNPRFPLPTPPPGSNVIHHAQEACSYAAGYTNARKLHEAALVGPGLTNLRLGVTTFTKGTKSYFYLQQRVAAQLEYQGRPELPPARATFLGFGFTPVSATLQISEIGSLNAALISCAPNPHGKCPNNPANEALFFGRVKLRIYNVDVNGVPLNVGPHCQTAPFNLELVGLPPAYSVAALQGVLTGTVTVPSFSGCSNGPEDLDPLFNATVSGPGNFVKINQAPFCAPHVVGHPGCPPIKPQPVH